MQWALMGHNLSASHQPYNYYDEEGGWEKSEPRYLGYLRLYNIKHQWAGRQPVPLARDNKDTQNKMPAEYCSFSHVS